MKCINKIKKWSLIVWAIFILISFSGCKSTAITEPSGSTGSGISASDQSTNEEGTANVSVKKGQRYSTKDEVAEYIKEYKELPPNFITKAEAQKLGWDNSKGNLWKITDHKSIGGDRFGNFEGLLPKAQGRQYYECDIDYYGGIVVLSALFIPMTGLFSTPVITTKPSYSFTRRGTDEKNTLKRV